VYCCSLEDVQRQRLCHRTGCDKTEAQQRIDAQMPLAEKCHRATVIIDNMGSIAELQQSVDSVHLMLRAKKTHWKIRLIAISVFGFFVVILWRMYLLLLFSPA